MQLKKDELNEDYREFKATQPDSNVELFIHFLHGDNSVIQDSFRWATSISDKYAKILIAQDDVIKQIPKWQSENQEINLKRYGGRDEGIRLSLRYETYLNCVYSFCETLSEIVTGFYPKVNLPRKFNDQKKRFLKEEIDPEYSKILQQTDWYNEVHAIRSEATHFLSGITIISQENVPGYFNDPKSTRQGSKQKISIDSVESHIQSISNGLNTFRIQFGDHFLPKLDHNARITQLCMQKKSTGQTFFKTISLKEYLNGEAGQCITTDIECPKREYCKANSK